MWRETKDEPRKRRTNRIGRNVFKIRENLEGAVVIAAKVLDEP